MTGLSDEEVTLLEDEPEEIKEVKPLAPPAPLTSEVDVARIVQEHISRILPKLTEEIKNEVNAKMVPLKTKSASSVVHECVRCDGCQKKPIVGIRYKCAICHDFDFCEECEAQYTHPHPFLKIRSPGQAPKSIMVAIEDNDRPGLDVNGRHFAESFFPSGIFGVPPPPPPVPEFNFEMTPPPCIPEFIPKPPTLKKEEPATTAE